MQERDESGNGKKAKKMQRSGNAAQRKRTKIAALKKAVKLDKRYIYLQV